jgi:hypothetical protein
LWVADTQNNRVLLFQEGVTVQITRGDTNPTNADSLTFVVTFDGPVRGLTSNNFDLTSSGTLSGASIAGLASTSASVYTVTVNTGTGEGTLRLDLVNAADLFPAVLTALPYTDGEEYTIDRTAPAAPGISRPTADSFINTDPTHIVISGGAGAAEAGATVTVQEGIGIICTATVTAEGSWTCPPPVPIGEGTHSLTVTQTDLAGNVSPARTLGFTIDTDAPAAPLVTFPASGSKLYELRPIIGGWAGAAEAGATVAVKEGNGTLCTAPASNDGSWSCTPATDLGLGDHNLSVTQTDQAGNLSPVSPRSFTILTRLFLPVIQTVEFSHNN